LADYWLANNFESDSLFKLCYVDKTDEQEIYNLFKMAMNELSLKAPSVADAQKILIKSILEKMVNTELDVYAGMRDIDYNLYPIDRDDKYRGDALGFEKIFMFYRELTDCRDGSMIFYYDDLPREEAEQKFIEHILEESKIWLDSHNDI